MGCEINRQRDHVTFACRRRASRVPKCSHPGCTTRSTRLCDFPTPTGSCDAPLCAEHSRRVAPNVDHCLDHLRLVKSVTSGRPA